MIELFLALFYSLLIRGHNFYKGLLKDGCGKKVVVWLFMSIEKLFKMTIRVNSEIELKDFDYKENQ